MNFRFIAAALVCGLVFGLGLGISGLANPDKVLQFLTLDANWSPALMFTMGTGVIVAFIGFRFVRRSRPVFCDTASMPAKTEIDRPLIIGAVIFGAGWGLAGFCPGPAITALSSGMPEPFIFVAALIIGSQIRRMTT